MVFVNLLKLMRVTSIWVKWTTTISISRTTLSRMINMQVARITTCRWSHLLATAMQPISTTRMLATALSTRSKTWTKTTKRFVFDFYNNCHRFLTRENFAGMHGRRRRSTWCLVGVRSLSIYKTPSTAFRDSKESSSSSNPDKKHSRNFNTRTWLGRNTRPLQSSRA